MNSGYRRSGLLLIALLGALIASAPARALEELVVDVPLLETKFRIRLSELQSRDALRRGNSDLAELDRATNGAAGRQLLDLVQQPVPISLKQVAEGSVGSPLVEQAMLVLSTLGTVEGRQPDLSGRTLKEALLRASAKGEPTLLSLMQAIPGERMTLNLGRARLIAGRMARQRRQAEALLASTAPAPVASGPKSGPSRAVNRRTLSLKVPHRDQPLEVMVIEPASGANGRLVLISHGLWDTPRSFEGWGTLLAARGYTVLLPRHPGSDSSQQQAVLNGQAPPPGPEELVRRPRDLSAVLDAAADGRLAFGAPVDARRAVVLGHSWGATTALQLAGVRPSDGHLRQRCGDVDDPERNLSWTLQCSWLEAVPKAALRDPRVIAVGAVSPPASLLFPRGSGSDLSGRVLVVSGSRDWVVPPDPEAVAPMRWGKRQGNQLVLVQDGDHFNLRPGDSADGGVLGPLLLSWTDAAFAAGDAVRPRSGAAPLLTRGAWGSQQLPLADVTPAL
ncbi:MAG: esterase [Cyanobium sp. CACIAM 14]|nr:MAG: esterase [Cyanobium sp. CACIAM 14]